MNARMRLVIFAIVVGMLILQLIPETIEAKSSTPGLTHLPLTPKLSGSTGSVEYADFSYQTDTNPPTASVNQLPQFTIYSRFTVSWSGSDDLSGIDYYNLQVMKNDGPWQTVLEQTHETSYQMTNTQYGDRYGFRVQAVDKAGNIQPWSAAAQATTTVFSGPVAAVLDFVPEIITSSSPVTNVIPVRWIGFRPPGITIVEYELKYRYSRTGGVTGVWSTWQVFSGTTENAKFDYASLGYGDGLYEFFAIATDSNGQKQAFDPLSGLGASVVLNLDSTRPLYHIAGHVNDHAGKPLAGAAISAGGRTTLSTADGAYKLSALEPATYAVQVQLSGRTFVQSAFAVPVPPSITSVDFVALPEPVVFMPGIMGSKLGEDSEIFRNEWWPNGRFYHNRLALNLNPLPLVYAFDVIRRYPPLVGAVFYDAILEHLENNEKYDLYRLDTPPFFGCDYLSQSTRRPTLFVFPYDWRRSIDESAYQLKLYVDCIHQFYPGSKINIVAHSMGGLVARRYILDNVSDHSVRRLITLGTPWLGAPKALNVLETGDVFGDWLKELVVLGPKWARQMQAFFPGGHQLLPSQHLNEIFFEYNWDANRDGKLSREGYTYDELVSLLDNRYPRAIDDEVPIDGACEPRLIDYCEPGTISARFHANAGQDLWADVPTDVEYHYIYGVVPFTIGGLRATTVTQCEQMCYEGLCTALRCPESAYGFTLLPTVGDGTVPLTSARRLIPGEDRTGISEYMVTGEHSEHSELPQNRLVIDCISNLLRGDPCLQTVSAASAPVPADYYTLLVSGIDASSMIIENPDRLRTGIENGSYLAEGPSDVLFSLFADSGFSAIVPVTNSYTATFRAGSGPFVIKIRQGDGATTDHSIVYKDVTVNENAVIQVVSHQSDRPLVQFDADGDDAPETILSPNISVTGALAMDDVAPEVNVEITNESGVNRVFASASDTGSGVRHLYYSLDGEIFQVYLSPLSMPDRQASEIYFFAEDNVSNRSTPVAYSLPSSSRVDLFLPVIER